MYNHYYHPRFVGYDWQDTGYFNGHRQISIEEAMNIAVGRVPGQIVKVELDEEKGFWVYQVDIITSQGVKYEVEVDIDTGNIVKVEMD